MRISAIFSEENPLIILLFLLLTLYRCRGDPRWLFLSPHDSFELVQGLCLESFVLENQEPHGSQLVFLGVGWCCFMIASVLLLGSTDTVSTRVLQEWPTLINFRVPRGVFMMMIEVLLAVLSGGALVI